MSKKKRKFKTKPKVPYADSHGAHCDKPMKWYPSDDYVNNYEKIDWSDDGEKKTKEKE